MDNRADVLSYLAAPPIALDLRRSGMRRDSSACPQAGSVVVKVARWESVASWRSTAAQQRNSALYLSALCLGHYTAHTVSR